MNYSAYGLVLSSAWPLVELPPSRRAHAALTITRNAALPDSRGWQWLQPRPRRRDGTWVAIATRGGDFRIVFDGGADFVFSPGTAAITMRASSSTSSAFIRHRLIDQVVPLAMSHFGRFVLHASAVSIDGAAAAFVGAAGAGKSTLASIFARTRTPVLADDALFLEPDGWLAVPAYPGLRLWSARGVKRHVATVPFATQPRPLRRIYALERSAGASGQIRIERVSARDTMMTLLGYTFVLNTHDRERMAAHFSRAASAAAALDVRRLIYPGNMAALPLVRRAVLEDLDR